jgi:hypothetical protein
MPPAPRHARGLDRFETEACPFASAGASHSRHFRRADWVYFCFTRAAHAETDLHVERKVSRKANSGILSRSGASASHPKGACRHFSANHPPREKRLSINGKHPPIVFLKDRLQPASSLTAPRAPLSRSAPTLRLHPVTAAATVSALNSLRAFQERRTSARAESFKALSNLAT